MMSAYLGDQAVLDDTLATHMFYFDIPINKKITLAGDFKRRGACDCCGIVAHCMGSRV